MFEKVLVANRGEIAIRVMRTLEELGVASVAVYSEPDRDAPHVRRADEAYLLGPGPAAESYLVVEKILEVARQSGAEAIHPGYGFLAENAAFARACEEAGIVFIGPPADAIDAMGSKTRARELMREAGVPIVPGTTDPVETVEDARKVIDESIGYPVAIKAAGGRRRQGLPRGRVRGRAREGLRGRRARGREVLLRRRPSTSSATCPTRATSRCRCSPTPHGNVIHLFERDCSVQRRHQKLIEESPGAGRRPRAARADRQDRHRRRARGRLPRRPARSRACSQDGEYFFLEMNTRVQVEHCVTEMVTGIDIVREQIKIAAGEPLGYAPGRRRAARPRDRVPHQRRGRLEELRARARADRVATASPPGRSCASTPAPRRATRSCRSTTR